MLPNILKPLSHSKEHGISPQVNFSTMTAKLSPKYWETCTLLKRNSDQIIYKHQIGIFGRLL